MALLAYPPDLDQSRAAVRRTLPPTEGWQVYAVQKALNDGAGGSLSADGYFGSMTEDAVRKYQISNKVTSDGIVGPTTKSLLTQACARRVDRTLDLPDGLIRQMGLGEGGDNISAINPYDPPGGAAGTDCGIIQYRCYEKTDGSYALPDLRLAFSPYDAMMWAGRRFMEACEHYLTYGWCRNNRVRAERCALLYHNWPVGANDIAFEGILSNADRTADWAMNKNGEPYIHFLDGGLVLTRRDWANFYAGVWQDKLSTHQSSMAKSIDWGV